MCSWTKCPFVFTSHGAEEVEPERGGAASAGPGVVPFQGRAYRLGDPSTQSEVIEGPQVHQKRKVITLHYMITAHDLLGQSFDCVGT